MTILAFLFAEDFPHAWALLLDHIEGAALCQNAEISIAAIKSFQEMLLIQKEDAPTYAIPTLPVKPPTLETINRTGESPAADDSSKSQSEAEDAIGSDYDIALWSAAWKVWLNIGSQSTKPPEDSTSLYVPSQPFLTALIQTFPPLLDHIKVRFSVSDLQKLSEVLKRALTVPVHGDSSPFIIPTFPDVSTTPLQEATLQAVEALIKVFYTRLVGRDLTLKMPGANCGKTHHYRDWPACITIRSLVLFYTFLVLNKTFLPKHPCI